ncbi:glycosyltransferase [Microbacterium fluvii]|uniref:Glycosyltransferase n=1 Tax=Microbacterium fluvii TaxID=415215 RepID=A0ABW2H8U6_9MICO|nr:glycosyltransferase [Microbacterium fluvii]MCU4671413.1 glycosyltransferase [Microbacterium fluvii]
MTATLRVLLDQLTAPTDPDLAVATRELTAGLIAGAPTGCEVEGIIPSAPDEVFAQASLSDLAAVHRTALARRELGATLALGSAGGIGGGMIHSPTLLAPLVKHDRVHDNDQTVVTLWDLRPWEAPDELSRTSVAWHRSMLKRAVKHADAVVVPTHAMAQRLGSFAKLGSRIRVIGGAAGSDLRVPSDEIGRRRELGLPDGFVLMAGTVAASDALATGLAALGASGIDIPVVVIDAGEGEEPAIVELAASGGVPERRVHVRGPLSVHDRAAVYAASVAYLAPSRRHAFPWRALDALALGVPVLAVDSPVHREIVVDGGVLTGGDDPSGTDDRDALAAALLDALGSTEAITRLGVMSADRGRVFSWREAAERVWQLHADL